MAKVPILYRLATTLLEPFTPGILRRRAKRGKEDPTRLTERLGQASVARPQGPLAWFHAVSVGESLSVLPLIERLRERRPDVAVLVTSGTVTSAGLLARRLPAGAIHQYAPLDTPGAAKRFLGHWRPEVVVFVESEFWPNLILGARAQGAKLILLSARVTEKTAKGWRRAPKLARDLLATFDAILPQDRATAERIGRFGVTAGAQVNLKFIGEPLACDEAELARLRAAIGDRPVILAASTHPGEEAVVVEAFRSLPARTPKPLLIMAPRHPERGAEVAGLLKPFGLKMARRSQNQALTPDLDAYVADTLGEMGLMFRLSALAVMGGSFVEGIGGHNPLEPARLGVPPLTGPHAFNFSDVYDEMLAEQAALLARDGADLSRLLETLLADPALGRRIGATARAFARARSDTLDRAWKELDGFLP